jgi:lipid A 3-O-deacylase
LRWNFSYQFAAHSALVSGAGGLIYTTHKFPPDCWFRMELRGEPVFNFSPQGGGGIHYFTRPSGRLTGRERVHISSASLGDRNPGVNASIQVQVGYTFWK